MKRQVKPVFIAVWLGLLAALPATAQRQRPERNPDPQKMVDRTIAALDRRLDLSDSQTDQLRELLVEQRADAKAWRDANPEATREEQQAHREEERATHRAQLENILTPEQLETIDEKRPQRLAERVRPHRGVRNRRMNARGPAPLKGLELTEEQRTQIRELLLDSRPSDGPRRRMRPDGPVAERRAAARVIRERQLSVLKSVLPPEQLEVLEARRAERVGILRSEASEASSTGVETVDGSTQPSRFALTNFPNPFNPSTEIRFELPEAGHASLVVYDLRGRVVATLIDEQLSAGEHSVRFEADRLPAGTYFSRLQVGDITQTSQMILTK